MATDVKNNNMIHLPPPMVAALESEIVVRNQEYKKTFSEYVRKEIKKGIQKENLTREQKNGLEKLKKRIKEK